MIRPSPTEAHRVARAGRSGGRGVFALALALAAPAGAVPAIGAWYPGGEVRCLSPGAATDTPDQHRIAGLMARIEAAAPGDDPLLVTWGEGTAAVCLDDRPIDAMGYFEPVSDLIVLDGRLSDDDLAAVLVHELRHELQYRRGIRPTARLHRVAFLRMVLAMEADALAITSLYAARARDRGDPGLWNALTGSLRNSADVALAFGAARDAGASEAEATGAAFDAWDEEPDRLGAYVQAAHAAYLDALDEGHLRPGTSDPWPDAFDRLCRMPEGDPYPCEARP